MPGLSNELVLSVVLGGMGLYFLVLVVRVLAAYWRFLRLRTTALLTWPARRPPHFPLLIGLGVLALGVAILNGSLHRPLHHVASQLLIAVYFVLVVPLATSIRQGLYRDGVWADGGFLPYAEIARLAFVEGREIVLVMLARGRGSAFRLPVPPEEYGAVRKVIEGKIRSHAVTVDSAILGL